MRIVSLVPSITEALLDLNSTDGEIIGRTKFCIHPKDKVKNIEIIGGTKNINIKKVIDLKPDYILANKEENLKFEVEELMKNHNVILTDIVTLDDNYKLLETLGKILNKEEIAKENAERYEKIKEGKYASGEWKRPQESKS